MYENVVFKKVAIDTPPTGPLSFQHILRATSFVVITF